MSHLDTVLHDLEICIACDNEEQAVANAVAAAAGGADRLECCAGMNVGGLTPSAEVINAIRQAASPNVDVLVMIRPRDGDFSWSASELSQMASSIEAMAANGAQGVVSGAISDGIVDIDGTQQLIQVAQSYGLSFTFHRAIDAATDRIEAASQVIDLGVDRILTAGTAWGGSHGATAGLPELTALHRSVAGNAEVVIGGGVSASTLPLLINPFREHRLVSFHAYSSVLTAGRTDTDKVRGLKAILS